MSLVMPVAAPVLPRTGPLRWLSDLLYTRRGLLLAALLGPPLLWFGVVYLGSLFALLANSFFTLDEFSGVVDRSQLSLNNFREMTEPANVDVVLRTVAISGSTCALHTSSAACRSRIASRDATSFSSCPSRAVTRWVSVCCIARASERRS